MTLFRKEKLRHSEVQQLLHPHALLAIDAAVIPTMWPKPRALVPVVGPGAELSDEDTSGGKSQHLLSSYYVQVPG